jgi:tetratricopeptide (TPR) repeat protein
VCLFIEQRWGFERLAALLHQFDGKVMTPAAIQATFKISPEEFDKEFNTFVRARYSTLLASMREWEDRYSQARKAMQAEQWSDVIEPAKRAAELYPEHVGPGSPNLLLARALDKLGRRPEAIAAIESYYKGGGWDPDALRELARWLDETGRGPEATGIMETLNYADPFNADQHAQLGERLLAAERAEDSLREFQALRSLREHDQAQSLFGSARALRLLGDRAGSRRYVLDALAVAPHYRPAQEFLLQLIEERTKNE